MFGWVYIQIRHLQIDKATMESGTYFHFRAQEDDTHPSIRAMLNKFAQASAPPPPSCVCAREKRADGIKKAGTGGREGREGQKVD